MASAAPAPPVSTLLRRARIVPVTGTASIAQADDAAPDPTPSAPVDVRVRGDVVVAIAPHLPPEPDETLLDVEGRFLIPGLWDQHVHMGQWAATLGRIDLSGATSAADAAAAVGRVLRRRSEAAGAASAAPPTGRAFASFPDSIQGRSFRDALWPDRPDRALLDAVSGDVPVVLYAADMHCGWLNSAALSALGMTSHPTGLLREREWFSVMTRLASAPLPTSWYATAAADAAARGVVGIVDVEWERTFATWPARVAAGVRNLRVSAAVWPEGLTEAIGLGLRTGAPLLGGEGLLRMGPLKIIADGSLNTRTAACYDPYPDGTPSPYGELAYSTQDLRALLARAKRAGIEVAVHAVGDRAVTDVLDAFEATGARGRVEHAQLIRPDDVLRFAALGLVASVQPAHLLDDRRVADAYWAGRTGRAFPLRLLIAAGASVVLGSDAPVAPLDPWLAIAAAVGRGEGLQAAGAWHPEQSISAAEALAASTNGRGTVRVGDVADLAVLDDDPVDSGPARLRAMGVFATLLGGRLTHLARRSA